MAETYTVRGIEEGFWRRVRAKAALKGITLRKLIIELLDEWLERP